MNYVRATNSRRQITLPPSVLRDAGAPEGGYFAVRAEHGRIVLEPRDVSGRGLEKEDWELLDRLVERQIKTHQYKRYDSPQDAKKHLDRFR